MEILTDKTYIIREWFEKELFKEYSITKEELISMMIAELEKFDQRKRRSLCIYTSDDKHCIADWSIDWWDKII